VIGRVESEYVWSLTRMEIWLDGSTRNCRVARNRHVDIHKHAQHRQRFCILNSIIYSWWLPPCVPSPSCRGTLSTPLNTGGSEYCEIACVP